MLGTQVAWITHLTGPPCLVTHSSSSKRACETEIEFEFIGRTSTFPAISSTYPPPLPGG